MGFQVWYHDCLDLGVITNQNRIYNEMLRRFILITTTVALGYLFISFSACTQNDPLSSSEETYEQIAKDDDRTQEDSGLNTIDDDSNSDTNSDSDGDGNDDSEGENESNTGEDTGLAFPLIGSTTCHYSSEINNYLGGKIEFGTNNKSKFTLADSALTPPAGFSVGDSVTITMRIDYDPDKGELIYSFGPHGCQFSPRAELKLDYGALNLDSPQLYYIEESGNYVEQEPDQVDINKSWLKIRIDHFSRYAVAWGE